jgi:hypothetical protein
MTDKFYMLLTGLTLTEVQLKATDWQQAIEEVKASEMYALTRKPIKWRKPWHIPNYIEVYRNRTLQTLSLDDRDDNNIYRRI